MSHMHKKTSMAKIPQAPALPAQPILLTKPKHRGPPLPAQPRKIHLENGTIPAAPVVRIPAPVHRGTPLPSKIYIHKTNGPIPEALLSCLPRNPLLLVKPVHKPPKAKSLPLNPCLVQKDGKVP